MYLSRICLVFIALNVFFTFLIQHPVYAVDTTPPFSTLTVDPTVPNGENNWYVTFPDVTITSSDDDTGVDTLYWKINEGSWQSSSFSSGLNLLNNPSFEYGYITDWDFQGPLFSVGFKSSFTKHSGNYSGVLISLSSQDTNWINTDYIQAIPGKTYDYSFYVMSYTSWLDNGFYEIILDDNGTQSILRQTYNIDLKYNYKLISGTFDIPSNVSANAQIFIKVGLDGIGHISVDDASISVAGDNPEVSFTVTTEGRNDIYYYAEDAAGNTEAQKQATLYVDATSPSFSNFQTFNEEGLQKFASSIDVSDGTSGLVSQSYYNYAVDGVTDGYYEDYAACSGNFIVDGYLDLSSTFSDGDNSGTGSTAQIDYCDTNWISCKGVNFYIKDLAGNIGEHRICVNGPYIVTDLGNIFGRTGIYSMGIGTEDSVYGIATSASTISDVSSSSGYEIASYANVSYLNNVYTQYLEKIQAFGSSVSSIDNSAGTYILPGDFSINSPLVYADSVQIVLVPGDLAINADITSSNSSVFYIVSGDVTIANTVTQVDVNIVSSSEIYTAEDTNISSKLSMSGSLLGMILNFNRNTDRTLGSSESVSNDIYKFFSDSVLNINNIYWTEK